MMKLFIVHDESLSIPYMRNPNKFSKKDFKFLIENHIHRT